MYVVDYLRARSIRFEALLHRPASSAARVAGTLHVPGRGVAKAVLVKAGEEFLIAVLPATSRVDLDRLARGLELDPDLVELAGDDDIVRTFHDCEPGAIPPFGRLYALRTVVDASLRDAGDLILGTNTRHVGVRMRFEDYEGLEAPLCLDFARPEHAGQGPASSPRRHRRRAG